MKKLFFFLLFLALSKTFFSSHACPICVGVVTKDSPPFFSDDFYKEHHTPDLQVDLITTRTK